MIFGECNSLAFSLLPRAAFLSNEIQGVDVPWFFKLFFTADRTTGGDL